MGNTGAALYRGRDVEHLQPGLPDHGKGQRLDVGLMPWIQEHEDRFQPLFDRLRELRDRRGHRQQPAPLLGRSFGLALHDPAAGLPVTVGLSWPNAIRFPTRSRKRCAILSSATNPRDSILEEQDPEGDRNPAHLVAGHGGRRR